MRVRLRNLLDPANEYRLIGLMLLALHGALWSGSSAAPARAPALVHLGLFLLWQPFWAHERRLSWRHSAVFFVAAALFVAWLNWWLMVFWLLVLCALTGGRVHPSRRDRMTYMLTLAVLVSELLIGCVPQMFAMSVDIAPIRTVFALGLPLPALALLFLGAPRNADDQRRAVDFLYGLTVALLVAILALGSVFDMYATHVGYLTALLQSLLALVLFLLAVAVLWMPFAGFGGLAQLWERYLLNLGTPFEKWLGGLAETARAHQDPAAFLRESARRIAELPWVRGVAWQSPEGEGSAGKPRGHRLRVSSEELGLELYTVRPMGAALLLHARLLLQLAAHFYNAKRREQQLARQAQLQAIYETGARVTHDIRNLLQSMHTLSSAMEHSAGPRREAATRMIEHQLPHLTRRLRMALEKLQDPAASGDRLRRLDEWWHGGRQRNGGAGIEWAQAPEGAAELGVPGELFDSALDNLLENARAKQRSTPSVRIRVTLACTPALVRLEVCDDGTPLAEDLLRSLFSAPVPSRDGLGIGLYQVARQAARLGYRLRLAQNVAGAVCFTLEGAPHPLPAAQRIMGGGPP